MHLGKSELVSDVVTEPPQVVGIKEWGEEVEGRENTENTSQMGRILNFGNLISQGCLFPRPTSSYTALKPERSK